MKSANIWYPVVAAITIGIAATAIFAPDQPIQRETFAVASAKCAYNGPTLYDTTKHRFDGLENVKTITGPSSFTHLYTITCDNGAEFRFKINWQDPLTDVIKTDKIVAPEK